MKNLLMALGLVCSAAHAAAQCTPITSVPYTIARTGVYCVTNPVNIPCTDQTSTAITVNAVGVTIDLGGFVLNRPSGGCPSWAGSANIGVLAIDKRAVTVRNGLIRGFARGVVFIDTNGASQNNAIENVRFELITALPVQMSGRGSVIRDSVFIGAGGSAVLLYSSSFVRDSLFEGFDYGLVFLGPGLFKGNMFLNVGTPAVGGTDGGNN